jgi:uncharacterized phage protein gp47/JayE
MPIIRPTLTELNNQAISQIEALIPNTDARMRFSVLGVFAKIWAGLIDGLYSTLNWLSRQLFVTTATTKYLTQIAESYGVNRLPATAAIGCVKVDGLSGTSIPLGTIFTSTSGIQYQTTQSIILDNTLTANINVICLNVGSIGNITYTAQLTPLQPIVGLTNSTVCTSGISGGSEEESDDGLRARTLLRLRNPPGAGTKSDWERWAFSLSASVTRVWILPTVYGNGTVGLVFAEDNDGIVPTQSRINQMLIHLAQFTPVGSNVYVFPPTLKTIDFNITLNQNADINVRNNVTEELKDLLYREASPAATVPLSHISEAISSGQGEFDHTLNMPTSPLTFIAQAPVFEIGALGVILWQ